MYYYNPSIKIGRNHIRQGPQWKNRDFLLFQSFSEEHNWENGRLRNPNFINLHKRYMELEA